MVLEVGGFLISSLEFYSELQSTIKAVCADSKKLGSRSSKSLMPVVLAFDCEFYGFFPKV